MKREKLFRLLTCLVLAGALTLAPVPALAAESAPARQETVEVRTPETGEELVPQASGDGQKPELPEALDWAVIIYMCASDLETNGGDASYALADILRMDLPDGLAVIAITGGAKSWDPLGTGERQDGYVKPSADENAVYWIQKGATQSGANRMVKLGALTENGQSLNMGDAATAEALFGLVDEVFPAVFDAEHLMLVFMDHGAAWAGAAVDEDRQDILDHTELRAAVAAAKGLHGNKNLDIIGFDACLMSCFEIAWQFRDLADYLVGSEEVGYTPCWLYGFLDTKGEWSAWGENGPASGVGALELAKSVVDTYIHAKEEGDSSYLPRTLAVTDLSKIEALRDAFAAFSNEVLGRIADELRHGRTPEEQLATFIRVARAAEATQTMRTARGMIDMYDFLDRLNQIDTLEGKADEVIAALGIPPSVEGGNYIGETTGNDPAVLYRGTCPQFDRSGGLSVYYPLASCTYPLSYLEGIYDEMKLMDSYGALLTVLGADTDREVIAFSGELETIRSDDGRFTVHVTEDADTIKKTEFVTTYTDFAEGVTYLLGTDLVTENWTDGTLSKEPYETWISVNDKPVTVLLDLDGDMNLDDTGVNLYTMPVRVELLNGNRLDAELSMIYAPENNAKQFQGLKYTISYEDAQGVTQSVSGSVPITAVRAAYPVLAEYNLETQEMTGDMKVYDEDPVLLLTEEGLVFSLSRTKLKSGSAGYYSSYFKVTDLAGNTFLSDPYAYVLADSYTEFYLGVVLPVLRDPKTGDIPKLSDGDIRIMYNGLDVTASVCPELDPASVVTYNEDKTMGTVRVYIDLGGDFKAGTLETYFAICADTESFMAACAELLNGQYACDPREYGEHPHPYGEDSCTDLYELKEHIRVVENVKYYYELGLDMQRDEDLRALNDAYALLIEEFDADLTSGDMELLSPFSAYGYADGLTFTAEKAAPAGNTAYQNITAGMRKVTSYRVGLDRSGAEDGTTPAVKRELKEPAAVKLALPDLSKSDIGSLRVYYMENGSATPQLIPWESSDNGSKDHITLVENRGEPYLVISTFQALNDSYFVLCVPSSGGGSGGGGSSTSGSATTPGAAGTTVKTATANSTTTGTTASATVSSSVLNGTVNSAVNEAARKGTSPVVEIKVNTSANADGLEVTLPAGSLETLAKANNSSLVITSGIAEVSLDHTALSALVREAAGSTIVLTVVPVEESALNAAQREAVGGAEVVDLSLASDGAAILDYSGGNITVTLPYTLKEGETASDIVVYDLDDDGNMTPCSTSYAGGKVTFTTTRLRK